MSKDEKDAGNEVASWVTSGDWQKNKRRKLLLVSYPEVAEALRAGLVAVVKLRDAEMPAPTWKDLSTLIIEKTGYQHSMGSLRNWAQAMENELWERAYGRSSED